MEQVWCDQAHPTLFISNGLSLLWLYLLAQHFCSDVQPSHATIPRVLTSPRIIRGSCKLMRNSPGMWQTLPSRVSFVQYTIEIPGTISEEKDPSDSLQSGQERLAIHVFDLHWRIVPKELCLRLLLLFFLHIVQVATLGCFTLKAERVILDVTLTLWRRSVIFCLPP